MDTFELIDIDRLEGAARRDVLVRLQKVELGIATDHDRFTLRVELRRQQLLDAPPPDRKVRAVTRWRKPHVHPAGVRESEGRQKSKNQKRAEKKRQEAAANRAAQRAADARQKRAEAAKEFAIRRAIQEVARDAAGPRRNLRPQERIRSVVSGGLPSLGKF